MDYLPPPKKRLRRSIQSHQRSLIKAAESINPNGSEKGEYHLDTLLHASENPKLTMGQQRELKIETVDFLLLNYQKVHPRYGTTLEKWMNTNANSITLRDRVLARVKDFDRSTNNDAFTSLNRVLLNLSMREDVGFSSEILAYFDALPLKEKVDLVGPSEEPSFIFNSFTAQLVKSSWGQSVHLHAGREKIQEKLNEYELFGDIHPLSEYISGELGLDGALGYYNQSIMVRLMLRQKNDTISYKNPFVQQIYILVEHRMKNALSIPDIGRPRENMRLKEPSAISILSILGEIGRKPSMLTETGWVELRILVNQNFDPQLKSYLSLLLPRITIWFDLLSSSTGILRPIDIFSSSDHKISSFIQD